MPIQNPEFSGSTTHEQPSVTDFETAVVNALDGLVRQTGKITKANLALAIKNILFPLDDGEIADLVAAVQAGQSMLSQMNVAVARAEAAARRARNVPLSLALGLDLNFAGDSFRFVADDHKIDTVVPTDIVGTIAGVSFSRSSVRTRVNSSGSVENVSSGVMAITHDLATGANPRLSLDTEKSNLARNPDWTGIVTGSLASGAALASSSISISHTDMVSVTVATGTEYGMAYAEFTCVADVQTDNAVLQIVLGPAAGADEIPLSGSTAYTVWAPLRFTANPEGAYNIVWRMAERDSANTVLANDTASNVPNEQGHEGIYLVWYGATDELSWVTEATTAKVRPVLQVEILPGETVTFRMYEWQIEEGQGITSLIRRHDSYPWTREADTLSVDFSLLPSGAWVDDASSIIFQGSMPVGIGPIAIDNSTVPGSFFEKFSALSGGIVHHGSTPEPLQTEPGYGSLNDTEGKVWSFVFLQELAARLNIAGGLSVEGQMGVKDRSAIHFTALESPINLHRLTLLPYALDEDEIKDPFATTNPIIDVDVEGGDLYITREATGREVLVPHGGYAFHTAWIDSTNRIRATRDARFYGYETDIESVAVSHDGKVIVPLTPNIFHGVMSIVSQSFEFVGNNPIITKTPPDGSRAFAPMMNDADNIVSVQYNTLRLTTSFTVIDPDDILGIGELKEYHPLQAQPGETPSSGHAAELLNIIEAVDAGQGPKFLWMNFAFSGTSVKEHGPTPQPLFDPTTTPPEGPFYEMSGAVPVHREQIEANGKKLVVPTIFGEIGWSDQDDNSGGGFIARFTATQTAINERLIGGSGVTALLEQVTAPVWLMGQICTRDVGALEEVDMHMVTMQTNGLIKIVGSHYALYPLGFADDVLHWNNEGAKRWGLFRARAHAAEVFGQGWWPTMPSVLLPASVRPANSVRIVGNTIEVDFTCPGDELDLYDVDYGNPAQGGMRYTRDVGGNLAITGYSVSGKTLTINFGSAPTAGVLGLGDQGQLTNYADGYLIGNTPRTVIGDDMDPPNMCILCRVNVS